MSRALRLLIAGGVVCSPSWRHTLRLSPSRKAQRVPYSTFLKYLALRSNLGMLAKGFPNMLMVLGRKPLGNITQAISHSVEFQADMLRFMQQHTYTHVETRLEKWTSGRGS
jgi:hypothetical protein